MASYCSCTILGNLTQDVQVKYTTGGTAVAEMTLAVNRKYKGKDDKLVESCSFLPCKLWGRTAEIAGEYLAKGKPVLVSGRIEQENWDDKTAGQKRSKLLVVVDNLVLLGGGGKGGERPSESSHPSEPTVDSSTPANHNTPSTSDDVPF